MSRAEYRRAHRAHRVYQRRLRCDMSSWERDMEARSLPFLPQPPRSVVGQLLLNQAARRQNRLYWIGYRKRQAERDAQPVVPSRIPQIAGWDRSGVPA